MEVSLSLSLSCDNCRKQESAIFYFNLVCLLVCRVFLCPCSSFSVGFVRDSLETRPQAQTSGSVMAFSTVISATFAPAVSPSLSLCLSLSLLLSLHVCVCVYIHTDSHIVSAHMEQNCVHIILLIYSRHRPQQLISLVLKCVRVCVYTDLTSSLVWYQRSNDVNAAPILIHLFCSCVSAAGQPTTL